MGAVPVQPAWNGWPPADATDRTGVVRVTLGADRLPTSITVDEDWRTQLRPDGFARAVAQACQLAGERQFRAWAALPHDESDLDAEDDLDADGGAILDADVTVPFHRGDQARPNGGSGQRPRDVEALLADAIEVLRDPALFAVRTHGVGTVGKLTIVVTHSGFDSCTADPDWLDQHGGEELTAALTAALAAARDDLTMSGPLRRLHQLLAAAQARPDERRQEE
jgi:hypothetical protein